MEAEKRFATTLLQALARRPVKTAFSFDPSPSLWAPLPPCSRPFDLIRKSDGEDANTGAPTETETLTITVKQLKGGSPIQLTVGKFETVDELKKKIEAATGVAPANQRLVLNGKGLTEGKTLFDFDIKDGGTISLLKKAGGAPAATLAGCASGDASAGNRSGASGINTCSDEGIGRDQYHGPEPRILEWASGVHWRSLERESGSDQGRELP
ncbi:ubiquitin-related domain-containing protein [Zopfochytrium polystomum]|nr:ubiquitin-related domain-containing protein [Zopfochytrium polystomum]